MTDPVASDTGFDMESAVADIGSSLGFDKPDEDDEPEAKTGDLFAETESVEPEPVVAAEPEPVVEDRPPPKSWAKEYHEDWGKLTQKQQEYIEKREKDFLDGTEQYRSDAGTAKQYREILAPYKPMLAAQGVSETQALQYLMNAQYRLTSGSPEERAAAYRQMGTELGLVQPEPEGEPLPPVVTNLQRELNGVKSTLSQWQQAQEQSRRATADAEVSKFASDPANLYLEEVTPDMVGYLNSGLTLKDAYEKAVWANPTTRAKEMARLQTEAETKLKEKARGAGEAAKKATATNIRGSESRKAPTEPKGNMDDTLAATLKAIKERPN
jgi:hypothetical protein